MDRYCSGDCGLISGSLPMVSLWPVTRNELLNMSGRAVVRGCSRIEIIG
jgi:hypothetical protein